MFDFFFPSPRCPRRTIHRCTYAFASAENSRAIIATTRFNTISWDFRCNNIPFPLETVTRTVSYVIRSETRGNCWIRMLQTERNLISRLARNNLREILIREKYLEE